MKKFIRWILILAAILIVCMVLASIILPKVLDLKAYTPKIEQMVTEKTGRPFTMGDDIDISVFPWLGLRLSNLELKNSAQFATDKFVSVKSFEARIKVLPLFKGDIEIGKFVLDSPRIYLETTKSGKGNWEGIGSVGSEEKQNVPQEIKQDSPAEDSSLPIKSLMVDTFAITNGFVQFTDQATGEIKTLTDFNLSLSNVGLEKTLGFDMKGKLDNMPLAMDGTFDSIGKILNKKDTSINVRLQAFDTLDGQIRGQLADPSGTAQFKGQIDLKSFSPRKLLAALGKDFPITTADPEVLSKLSFTGQISASPESLALSDAKVQLDDSNLECTAKITDFSRPDIMARLKLDQMDVDRYLPPKENKKADDGQPAPTPADSREPNFSALRKMVLDLQLEAGQIKVANLQLDKTRMTVTGKDGIFRVTPLHVNLYEGEIDLTALADVSQSTMKSKLGVAIQKIQAAPLLRDSADFSRLEGTLQGRIDLAAQGNDSDSILKTADGQGDLLFTDGAIVGIDLAAIIRDTSSMLKGTEQQVKEKPKTDFSELSLPFSLSRGVATINNASLKSPLLRIVLAGDANLPEQTLDMRLTPKVVSTIKGQGDTKDRSGLAVPLKITGTFSNPKVRPDLEGKVKDTLSDPNQVKKLLKGDVREEVDSLKKEGKNFLKGLLDGDSSETEEKPEQQ